LDFQFAGFGLQTLADRVQLDLVVDAVHLGSGHGKTVRESGEAFGQMRPFVRECAQGCRFMRLKRLHAGGREGRVLAAMELFTHLPVVCREFALRIHHKADRQPRAYDDEQQEGHHLHTLGCEQAEDRWKM